MRIDPLVNLEPQVPNVVLPRPLFRVGAILEAIAVREVASGQLWLQLDNQHKLPARIASGPQEGPANGELLKLRVLRDSPVLALETIDESPAGMTVDDALRRVLPQQSSPTPLLANLGWLVRHPQQLAEWPPAVQRSVLQLWNRLPVAEQLTDATQLQEALIHSGTFLEAELASSQATPATAQAVVQQDYKAALLTLRAQMRQLGIANPSHTQPSGPVPSLATHVSSMPLGPASMAALDNTADQVSELKQQVEGSLARVQTNQLLHDQATQQGLQHWLIEVPIRNDNQAELLRFKIERDARATAAAPESWTVEVALDMGALGTLHAELQLHSQLGLNIKLRSESPALIAALDHELPILSGALQSQGLQVNRILCLHGLPVDSVGTRLNKLLDLHA